MDFGSVEYDGFVRQRKELEALLMNNPEMENKVQKIIRTVLYVARKRISQAASVSMSSDPRHAYRAVRSAVYRQILGGNVSILSREHRGAPGNYDKPRVLRSGQRGGNRMARSQRTISLESYAGPDRGFILRFLNAGTGPRESSVGHRGMIAARNFFGNSAPDAMRAASDSLARMIDELIREEMGE